MPNVLLVGSGGREAAMAWKLSHAPDTAIHCAPGNAGMQSHFNVPIAADNIEGLYEYASEKRIQLAVFGPELPLVNGGADYFEARGIPACGPSKAAARAEGSKVWFKRLLLKYGIPTPDFEVFDDRDRALSYIEGRGPKNIVIKADGLMGGKGVVLPESIEEAEEILRKWMIPGSPGETVVIEDRLVGIESSVTAATDGKTARMFPSARDYKRAYDGDKGLNTGGMGAHTLVLSAKEIIGHETLVRRVLSALAREGCLYKGFLYLGIMRTENGPQILECNCRLGDPEAQVLLACTNGNFAKLCTAIAKGNLDNIPDLRRERHALCITVASHEYPSSSHTDFPIAGIEDARKAGALVFDAGTARREDSVFTTNKKGRVLSVVGTGETLAIAHTVAYRAVDCIRFQGMQHRTDIGAAYLQ